MAYDEPTAQRVRAALAGRGAITEKRMFGGLAFLIGGRMACGVLGDTLMVRVGPDAYEAALALPHTRPMDFTGRPLRGFVYVEAPGIRTDAALAAWVTRAVPADAPRRGRTSRRAR